MIGCNCLLTRLPADYQSEAADDEEVDGTEVKGQLAHLDDATLRERIATMGKGEFRDICSVHLRGFPPYSLFLLH